MNYENKCTEIDKLKAELDRYRPFDENTVKQLKQYYKISLTYTSNAIEGNTLTRKETELVIEENLTSSSKPFVYYQEEDPLSCRLKNHLWIVISKQVATYQY